MALGAARGRMLRMILRESALGVMGTAVRLPVSLADGRVLSTLLYGARATDIATVAHEHDASAGRNCRGSAVPARRAPRTDPMAALRYE